jgi:hypothetical protein
MNAKNVLSKIITLLGKEEEKLTYAKLKDGTIVESATFDVGEDLFVVSEDGTKTLAPDGEHELSLRDESGNENLIKVETEGGKIVERENVEIELADAETKEVEGLPNTSVEDEANVIKDIESPANNSEGLKPASMMAEVTEEVGPLPTTGDGLPAENDPSTMKDESTEISLAEVIEKLSYRIEEMEKKIQSMEEVKEEVVDKDADIEEELEEEELPKLDGAPIEAKLHKHKEQNFGKRTASSQGSFLSKLYK